MAMSKENFEQLLEQVLKNRIQSLEIDGGRFDFTPTTISSAQVILLAKAIAENTSLEKLIINYCFHFSLDAWKAIAEALRNHPTLWHLDLATNNIGPEISEIILVAITNSQSLRILNLNSNRLGSEGAQTLSRFIAHSRIQHLNVSSNELYTAGGIAIAKGVSQSLHLTTLIINFNELLTAGIRAITDAAASSRTLEKLELISNLVKKVGALDVEQGAAIGNALALCQHLRALIFGSHFGNFLSIADIRAVVRVMIVGRESLEVLNVNKCNLGSKGLSMIFSALRHSKSLTCLKAVSNMSDTKMDHETMKSIAEGVINCPSLLELDISSNCLTDKYAKELADIVRSGSLQRLGLGNNELDFMSTKAIMAVLPESSIQSLEMFSNDFTVEGCQLIAEMICHNPCLLELHLSFFNPISPIGPKGILDALSNSQSLQRLYISGDILGYREDPHFFDGIAHCRTLDALSMRRVSRDALKRAVTCNRTLQTVDYENYDYQGRCEEIETVLQQNRERQTILRSNWARVSTLMAFERANHNSALRHSVLPLLPEILKMAGYKLSKL